MSEVYVHQDEQETRKKAPYLQVEDHLSSSYIFALDSEGALS